MDAREQYKTADNLNVRMAFQQKYSVNKQGFSNWLRAQYELPQGADALELGCGTGALWQGDGERIARLRSLTLSDFSAGMLEEAKKTLGDMPNVSYRVIDATDIPLEDGRLDVVFANMMLYHVPDRRRAIAEMARVLKPEGTLYCATFGVGNISDVVCELLKGICDLPEFTHCFTLDNGAEQLRESFSDVELRLYPDSFRITDAQDVVDYISSLSPIPPEKRAAARDRLQARFDANGVWEVPKRYGTFVARKPKARKA